jgi:hypothetical protein
MSAARFAVPKAVGNVLQGGLDNVAHGFFGKKGLVGRQ